MVGHRLPQVVCAMVFVVLCYVEVHPMIIINSEQNENPVRWNGCIYRRSHIDKDFSDKCYNCTQFTNRTSFDRSFYDWGQEFFNCSSECKFNTICTTFKYYIRVDDTSDPELQHLCYQCENSKTEDIVFNYIKQSDLCPKCSSCAETVGISTATKCAPSCLGRPTFCEVAKERCYTSPKWYGCNFRPLNTANRNISSDCIECATLARNEDEAQECSYICNGVPTYTDELKNQTLQCTPHVFMNETTDLLLSNIPKKMLMYFRVLRKENYYFPDTFHGGESERLLEEIQKAEKHGVGYLNRPQPLRVRALLENLHSQQ